jgi:hypothetical protein
VHALDALFAFCCNQANDGGFHRHQMLLVDLDVPAILLAFASQAFTDVSDRIW